MTRRFFPLALLALWPALAPAQSQIIYPGGTTGISGNAVPFSSSFSNDIRYQLWIPASRLTGAPALLTDLAFLPNSTGTLSMSSFELSFGPAGGSPTCNLDANAPAQQIQFAGAHTYTYTAFTFAPIGVPISYAYDGVSDLLIQLRIVSTSGGAAFTSVNNVADCTRVYNRLAGGSTASTCSHNPSVGLVLGLTFTPLVSPFALTASSFGGGFGNLDLAISGIPPDAFEGWTVMSLDTTGPTGMGSGYGLYFDAFTWSLLFDYPLAQPGHPIHWSWPTVGVWPDAPIAIPGGALSAFSGMSIDFLAVALGTSSGVTPSPVARVYL